MTFAKESTLPTVYLGLPVWQHSAWPKQWFGRSVAEAPQLASYSRQLNSIEGNTSFYSLPSSEQVQAWAEQVPNDFKFSFKLHQSITHKMGLKHCDAIVAEQLEHLSLMGDKLGVVMIQLPASFGPAQLPILDRFLAALSSSITLSVEVRHLEFFRKGEAEIALNQCLIKHGVNRIIMDTRALFTGEADSELTRDVRTKKPKVPVNVIATGDTPIVRFVGNNKEQDNARCLQPWIRKVHEWRLAGKTPYVFIHRPDNKDAPWTMQQFITMYNQAYPATPLPQLHFANERQADLFA